MKPIQLFEKSSSYGGIYAMFMVNRIQMLYYVLISPTYLVHPYMVWVILAMGLLSQLNLRFIAKWLASDYAIKGYFGFVKLYGKRFVRCLAVVGLLCILMKITVISLGYVELIHQFLFPSMNTSWLIGFVFAASCYLASYGMEKALRFVVLAFLGTFWMIFIFYPFFYPPMASLQDLYPVFPTEWSADSWKGLLFIWATFAGPEYLLFAAPWFSRKANMLRWMTIGNAISTFEYIIIFVASVLFYGSDYLRTSKFPVVNMIRYLQSPVFERIDMLMISIHMFHYVFAVSIFILFFYGAARIIAGTQEKSNTRIGLFLGCALILLFMLIVNKWFWKSEAGQNSWQVIGIWLGAITYTFVPAFLVISIRRKARDHG